MFGTKKKPEERAEVFSNDIYIPPVKPCKLRIKEVRKNAKLTQAEAASLLSTSQQQYSRWENGETDIPIMELCMLSIFFNRSVDYLLGMTNDEFEAFSALQRAKRIEAMNISPYYDKMNLWHNLLQSLSEAE